MRRRGWFLGFALFLTSGLVGCATAPRPTIELSEVVDRQVAEMQKSHEAFVSLYYAKLREDVSRFVDERWIPHFLDVTLAGETPTSQRLRQELDASYKLIDLDPASVSVIVDGDRVTDPDARRMIEAGIAQAVQDQRARFGETMLRYSRGAQREISRQRREMLEPIDAQEQLVLSSLRDGYADLMRASATIKGYLSSVVKVTEERDAILDKLGLLERQRALMDYTVDANDKTVALLEEPQDAREAMEEFRGRMEETKAKVRDIRDKLGGFKDQLTD